MSNFAENLRTLMAKRGWKQTEAAAALSVSQANISRWLSQNHEPSADVLIRIAKVFGVTLEELLRGPGPARPTPRAEFDSTLRTTRWFRQLRLVWQRSPKERRRIESALDLAWPNQKADILDWLNKK